MFNLYYATITNNNSTTKSGAPKDSSIQVRIIPELKDVPNNLLPWVFPFQGFGMSRGDFVHAPPEISDHVWVLFIDKYWKEGFYISGRYIEGLFDFTRLDANLPAQLKVDKNTSVYPNPRFVMLPDDSIMFYDTITGDKGIASKGSYIFIKGDGKVFINGGTQQIKLRTTGDLVLATGVTDSFLWKPNALGKCLFSSAVHGGPPLIDKLKGGI